MSSPIDPVRKGPQIRRVGRRQATDRAEGHEPEDRSVPAIYEAPAVPVPARPVPTPAVYAAQVLGQDGNRRGLRGGKETLDKARSTYNQVEYSGSADRRAPKGGAAKTEV